MSHEFDAGSWTRAAVAFDDAAARVGGMRVSMSAGGPTATDSALADMIAVVLSSVGQATGGLQGGLTADADQMRATGQSYEATEDAAMTAGSSFGGR